MKPSAVLLIDLENFYCSREDYCRNGPPPGYDRGRFSYDLDKLLCYARSMTADRATGAELPFIVKRAYADFNVSKPPMGGPPQFYLRQLPDELLSQGVEPVQVFRLSRGGGGRGSKNAADMRMAMDATALVASGGHVEHFILVTGDADFIPVILELKRHGHTVSVIGVTGATSPKIQRFVDNFELFEDLLAAEEVESRSGELAMSGDGIGQIAAAVRRLLVRNHPLRFAAVKPLLSKELGHPFDPGLFGCDTTGDFLRNNQNALGIVIRQGPHDSEIDLPAGMPNGTNGTGGSRVAPRPTARQTEKAPEKPPTAKQPAPTPEVHTAAHYRQLLANPRGAAADREGKVYAVPWTVLLWTCDAVVPLLTPPTGAPTHTTKLQPKLVTATEGVALPDIVKHVRLFYPTLRAGLPVQGADGVYALPAEMSGAQIRRGVLGYIAFVLKCRLTESAVPGDVRPDQLAAVFEPGEAFEQATAEFATALTEPAPAPLPKPVPKPAPIVEEFHTATGYVKLLKAGGPKGSDTEMFKVLPVPWPSVERICADAFTLLCPASGGAPLPRDQLSARLIDAGKELYVEKYDQHVRRVLGIFRLSCDVNEDSGLMSLHPDVTSGHDLRGRALGFLLQLLQLRLEEREVYDPIRTRAFVAALEAGPLTDRLAEEVAPAIEWLYRPVESAPPACEPVVEVPAEPSLFDVLAAQPEPTDPAADSGIVMVGFEAAADSAKPDLDPLPLADAGAPEPAPAPAEPGWDTCAFDGALPEVAPAVQPEQPTAHVRSDPHPEAGFAPPAAEAPAEALGAVGVALITSETVAAVVENAPPAPPVERLSEPFTEMAVEVTPEPPAEPEVDSVAFAPRVNESAVPAPAEPPTEVFAVEDIVTAMPVGDWVPEADPLFADLDAAERRIVLHEPVVRAQAAPPPLPLFPRVEEVASEVDRMKSPPPRRIVPPPLPSVLPPRAPHDGPQVPPPSESA